MSYLTQEQLAAANKANLETLFGLTGKALEGVEKLVELNLEVVKAALADAAQNAKAALAVKDVQELLALQATLLQPSADKATAYSRQLYEVLAATGAEFTKAAEAQFTDWQKAFMSAIDSAAKTAPAGSENVVTMVRSAISAANNAYESVQKAAKQAAEIAEANMTAVTDTAVKAAQGAAKPVRRAA